MNAFRPRRLLAFAWLVSASLVSGAETLEMLEKSAGEWVKLRLETTRLETTWRGERELLASMVDALNERAAAIEESRDVALAKTAKDREELESMRAKNEAAAADVQAAETRLKAVSARLIALRPSLPPRLSEALEMSYRSLADPQLPVGERMQVATTVLNRCAHFNRMVTAGHDVLTLEGEPAPKSLEVIYWGLSHGYAIDPAAEKAWLGSPSGGRWRWEPRPEAYADVSRLIAVATDRADPDFMTVPATVTRTLAENSKN